LPETALSVWNGFLQKNTVIFCFWFIIRSNTDNITMVQARV